MDLKARAALPYNLNLSRVARADRLTPPKHPHPYRPSAVPFGKTTLGTFVRVAWLIYGLRASAAADQLSSRVAEQPRLVAARAHGSHLASVARRPAAPATYKQTLNHLLSSPLRS